MRQNTKREKKNEVHSMKRKGNGGIAMLVGGVRRRSKKKNGKKFNREAT